MITNTSKILVIGSGGREHALAWKFAHTHGWDNVFTLPGNGGIPNSFDINPMDFEAVERFCKEKGVDLIFVGPEQPLAAGIVDYFRKTDIQIFGPTQKAAQLEASKIFAKYFMHKYEVSTARFKTFHLATDAQIYATEMDGFCVLKYDGLAAGKGVFVCGSLSELDAAIQEIKAVYGEKVPLIVEQRLEGDEISIIGFTDGKSVKLLQASQDHKQLLDGDKGPNTGGMGAYSPVEGIDPVLMKKIHLRIIKPTLQGIHEEQMDYKGMIYFGIMVENGIPYLLEYNARFGDPETEVLLPALKNDLTEVIAACLKGQLSDIELAFETGFFTDVVLVSGGYPKAYPKGLNIHGLDHQDTEVLVFHAGTKKVGEHIQTDGGRVLNVVAHGRTLEESLEKAYRMVDKIQFEGMFFRRDIGKRDNKHLQ